MKTETRAWIVLLGVAVALELWLMRRRRISDFIFPTHPMAPPVLALASAAEQLRRRFGVVIYSPSGRPSFLVPEGHA